MPDQRLCRHVPQAGPIAGAIRRRPGPRFRLENPFRGTRARSCVGRHRRPTAACQGRCPRGRRAAAPVPLRPCSRGWSGSSGFLRHVRLRPTPAGFGRVHGFRPSGSRAGLVHGIRPGLPFGPAPAGAWPIGVDRDSRLAPGRPSSCPGPSLRLVGRARPGFPAEVRLRPVEPFGLGLWGPAGVRRRRPSPGAPSMGPPECRWRALGGLRRAVRVVRHGDSSVWCRVRSAGGRPGRRSPGPPGGPSAGGDGVAGRPACPVRRCADGGGIRRASRPRPEVMPKSDAIYVVRVACNGRANLV